MAQDELTDPLLPKPRRFPIYRLTKWVHHPGEIESWLRHFESLDRNAGILLFDNEFSMWVQGKEYIEPPEIPNSEQPKGIPVNWCNDFLYFYPRSQRV